MALSSYSYQTTIVGSLIRLVSGNRLLKYPDEIHFPDRYTVDTIQREETRLSIQHSRLQQAGGGNLPRVERAQSRPHSERDGSAGGMHEKGPQQAGGVAPGMNAQQMERIKEEPNGTEGARDASRLTPPGTPMERPAPRTNSSSDNSDSTAIDMSAAPQDQPVFGPNGIPVYHTAEDGGKEDPNLVTWYGPDDPENPLNWAVKYKAWVAFQMALLTFAVYVGSSIYSAGIRGPNPDSVTEVFGVSETTGLVGLTVFVLGYGVGPMVWAPLSEFPNVGRLPVYVGTLFVFIALQFPTIYANNIHTLLAMRFLAGFFGSPCLAIGGATMGDMFEPKHLAYAIGVWGCGAVCGPVLGPLLGGFAYQAKGWTWTIWVLVWLSGACFVLICFCFPETSAKNILHRRMYRLRKASGHDRFKTQALIDSAGMTPMKIMSMILWRPVVLIFEPTLLVYNTYLALIYGLLYLWFESFPLVFIEVHGFNPGESGLAFMGIFVGAWLSCFVYCIYIYKVYTPYFERDGMLPNPEMRLQPAMIAAFCIPIAMFGFGWTGQYKSIHWIVPIIMSSFFGIGAFILFQAIFGYFGETYYEEIGSVLTLNDLFRATFGAAFPLFAGAMFSKLGIGGGNSLVGGLACLFIPAPFLFVKYGGRIRRASKNACNKA